jgi:hypothetical protein
MTRPTKFLFALPGLLVFAVFSVLLVSAQSGRRTRPPDPIPVLTPEPTPPNKPTAKAKETNPTKVVVGIDRYSDVSDIPLSTYGSVLRSLADRLDDSQSVSVAKDEKENGAYVVSVQLLSRNTRVGFQTTRDLNDVYVDFAVFAPVTGKSVTSGKVFQQTGGILSRKPTGRTTRADSDYYLQQAAREAADKILAALHVRVPTGTVRSFNFLPARKAYRLRSGIFHQPPAFLLSA